MATSESQRFTLAANLQQVRQRIDTAALRAGRTSESVQLIAVSKYVSCEATRLLSDCGVVDLAESRPQQLWQKAAELGSISPSIRWHMIGHLQRNKVARTIACTELIHSVDSLRLLQAIDTAARAAGKRQRVLVEVNCSQEPGKTGLPPSEVAPLLAETSRLDGVSIEGLMTMAPLVGGPSAASRAFSDLRELRDHLRCELPEFSLRELSMGMSDDFELAIAEGATLVRVGSLLWHGIAPQEAG